MKTTQITEKVSTEKSNIEISTEFSDSNEIELFVYEVMKDGVRNSHILNLSLADLKNFSRTLQRVVDQTHEEATREFWEDKKAMSQEVL